MFRKKTIALVMAASMLLSLVGCGKSKDYGDGIDFTGLVVSYADVAAQANYVEPVEIDPQEDDPTTPEALAEQARFDEYLQESFETSVVSDSITLHYTLAHPENYGIEAPVATYGDADLSEEAIAKGLEDAKEDLAELESYDYDLLTNKQKFTYDMLHSDLLVDIDSYNYIYLYEPFAYTSGLQSNLPITLSNYTFYDSEDVDTYIGLLKLTPDYFNAYLGFERTKIEKGYFMNSNCADEVIRQCEEFIADPEHNLMIETFNTNIEEVPGLTPEQIETYKQENYDAVMNYIIPTYQAVIDFFTENREAGVNDLGLCYLEGGKGYYEYLIASKVGTDKTPEEIIAMLDERLQSDLTALTVFAQNHRDDYMAYVEEYDSLYPDSIDHKATIEYFEEAFMDKFPEIPAIDFTIEPVHESLEGIVSPAFYMTPPLDDYETNSIYTNLNSDGAGNLWSTLAHEGVPGHMYQFVYFLASDPYPLRSLLNYNGYQEGWATYVELMSYDYYTDYSHEGYATFERLQSELNLLVMARVEIGVNYEGWDLATTQQYLNSLGFNGNAAQDLLDYVIAEPANYQMYVTGWLCFDELLTYAQGQLADNFDYVEFHRCVLDAGPCQFFLLKKCVDQYIYENRD